MELLKKYAVGLGISLSDRQLSQFKKYYELLVEWNGFMNLTAITDFDEVMLKHFADSIALIKGSDNNIINDICNNNKSVSMIDVGTGAGFPSLRLKIVYPHIKLTMLDSLNKRINFLNEVIGCLGLSDVEAIHGRAEEYATPGKLRESFDIGVSRAVANLSTLSEYCLPYIKEGGIFVAYKSEELLKAKSEENVSRETSGSEKDNAMNAIKVLGGKIENIVEYDLCDAGLYRCLCIIKKEGSTPKKYPRKAGLPSKEPIK